MNPEPSDAARRAAEEIVRQIDAASRAMKGPRFLFHEIIDQSAAIIERETGIGELKSKVASLESEIRLFLELSDDCAERHRGIHALLNLADEIEERHPHLATTKESDEEE